MQRLALLLCCALLMTSASGFDAQAKTRVCNKTGAFVLVGFAYDALRELSMADWIEVPNTDRCALLPLRQGHSFNLYVTAIIDRDAVYAYANPSNLGKPVEWCLLLSSAKNERERKVLHAMPIGKGRHCGDPNKARAIKLWPVRIDPSADLDIQLISTPQN